MSAGSLRWVSPYGVGWTPGLLPFKRLIFTPSAESLKNTFSATSDRRKIAGFNRISSGTFLVLSLAANTERDERMMTNRDDGNLGHPNS